MRNLGLFLVFALIILSAETLSAQINISNLLESQYGKLPDESADFFPSIYNRSEITYRKKGLNIASTIEQYHTTFDGRSYFDLSQLTVGYKKKKWDIKLGNFYETLGRGLLMRSFEIPGALLEDIGFRSRNYFHRDVLGASVKYQLKKASFQIIRADVLNNVLPPTFNREARRTDLITAIHSKVKYAKGHEVGMTVMNLERSGGGDFNYLGGHIKGKIVNGLNYYGELAGNVDNDDYALYTGLTGFKGAFSFVLEYKKYDDFVLGAGINEPPAGVKQQTYRVLNRSIHVSNPLNEEGYQIDLFYNFENGTVLNVNHSMAQNTFGNNTFTFRQYFIEVQSSFGGNVEYKAFIDYSKDPFKGEDDRFSVGFYGDIGVNEKLRVLPELEYQTFQRNDQGVYNFNWLLGFNINSKLFISSLSELTNDPFIVKEGKSSRLYFGNTIRYTPSYQNTFQFFFGTRRGGPQCSAGVCYEILDFKGVELRWIGRLKIKTK